MNKKQLVAEVVEVTGLKHVDVEFVVNEVFSSIRWQIKKGKEVKIVGFGTFNLKKCKERVGRNPQTGRAIKVPATKRPKFYAHKSFVGECK